MSDQLWQYSASELAKMIRNKDVSSEEVVQDHLQRIGEVNPKLNSITIVLEDSSLAEARKADQSEPVGPLHGVPVTVKENIDLFGTPTTSGIPAGAELMPTADAPVVKRLKDAGAIPIGRTNLPELGLRIDTDNPLRGRTLNPWDQTRTAGGSSRAASVARRSPDLWEWRPSRRSACAASEIPCGIAIFFIAINGYILWVLWRCSSARLGQDLVGWLCVY